VRQWEEHPKERKDHRDQGENDNHYRSVDSKPPAQRCRRTFGSLSGSPQR
jgi:hypothetical protein